MQTVRKNKYLTKNNVMSVNIGTNYEGVSYTSFIAITLLSDCI